MSNSKRGTLKLAALGETFVLRVSTNAMVGYQDLTVTGETFEEGLKALQASPSDLKRARDLICSVITREDTGEGVSLDVVGDIMDDVGFGVAATALFEATALAFPSEDDAGEKAATKGGKASPKKKPTR